MAKKTTYVPAPHVAPEMRERFATMLLVLGGELTVKAGAKKLGLSRNRFQTLMNRTTAQMLEALSPHKPGRPATPEREAQLWTENEKLRRENERLRDRTQMTNRMLEVVGEVMRGEVKLRGRAARTAPAKKKEPSASSPEEPDGSARERLGAAERLCELGLGAELAARAVGASSAEVRRWRHRMRKGLPLCNKRGPSPRRARLELHDEALIEDRVRELGGQVGAASLSKSFPVASRRKCHSIKKDALRMLERERIANTNRITVTAAGVVRGFDQMYVATTRGTRLLLFSADGAVQYRTSVAVAEHYDGPSVARAVERDFCENGAPLVWRADRASSHRTDDVAQVLRRHGVLILHGPPRHPRFYGQTERQNRKHRAFFDSAPPLDPDRLPERCARILRALNMLWKRPTLGWRTANEVWVMRPTINDNRDELRDEVQDCAARIARGIGQRNAATDLAQRLAIESVLSRRGYLKRQLGGWC
jgi:hypothetical protein